MSLRNRIANPAQPLVLYEVIPPRVDLPGELEDRLELVRDVGGQIDAINIPEIREEQRNGPRRAPLPKRMEPRQFAEAIRNSTQIETIINRVTVHESPSEQRRWLRETHRELGVRNLILVGGESEQQQYPGPGVAQTASLVAEEGLEYLLGGITIPHRPQEASRLRQKAQHGLQFFTTQVLLDHLDIQRLLHELDGLPVRIVLSFTPVSNPRDLTFLEWLGVEIPPRFVRLIREASSPERAVEQSLEQARNILSEVLAKRSPGVPALGIQVERITKRNSAAARRMLAELGDFYRGLMGCRPAASARGLRGVGSPAATRRSQETP